jgi:uncharacterized protein (DUF1330 family)
MSYYFLAAIRAHDAETYSRYQAAARANLVADHRFDLLAVSPEYTVEEGELDATDLVLLRFPDQAEFEAWWHSDRYQEIKSMRLASAETLFAATFEGA